MYRPVAPRWLLCLGVTRNRRRVPCFALTTSVGRPWPRELGSPIPSPSHARTARPRAPVAQTAPPAGRAPPAPARPPAPRTAGPRPPRRGTPGPRQISSRIPSTDVSRRRQRTQVRTRWRRFAPFRDRSLRQRQVRALPLEATWLSMATQLTQTWQPCAGAAVMPWFSDRARPSNQLVRGLRSMGS